MDVPISIRGATHGCADGTTRRGSTARVDAVDGRCAHVTVAHLEPTEKLARIRNGEAITSGQGGHTYADLVD